MAMGADPTKVMGRRVIASLIDGTLVIVPAALIASSQFEYLERSELNGVTPTAYCSQYIDQVGGFCVSVGDRVYFDKGGAGPSVTLFGLAIVMFVVLQGLTGWTVGKLITGIRTVREDGQKAGLLKCLIRWLMWIVDGLPFAALVGFIVALTSSGHRRVGDMVAKTFVVRSTSVGQPVFVPGVTAPPTITTAAGTTPWITPDAGAVAPPPTAKPGPQWDEARGTYIQWDPEQRAWMQWDEAGRIWNRVPGQAGDAPPPPPPPPPAIT
jgi:uncharacterized RDD family membrane protein YckC